MTQDPNDLDEFYKYAVQQGLERLGFERLVLFLYDPLQNMVYGTYGTDVLWRVGPERDDFAYAIMDDRLFEAFESAEHFVFYKVIGTARQRRTHNWDRLSYDRGAAQWATKLGWLSADNLISQKPAAKPLLEILALYGLTLGTLLAHKQAVYALKNSETRLRKVPEDASECVGNNPRSRLLERRDLNFLGANRLYLQDVEVASVEDIIGRNEQDMPWAQQVSAQFSKTWT